MLSLEIFFKVVSAINSTMLDSKILGASIWVIFRNSVTYMDLRIEIMGAWKCRRAFVVLIIIGALGSIPKDLPLQLEKLQLPVSRIKTFQKSAFMN